MDILHMNPEEIRAMDATERGFAVNYAWQAYVDRRVGPEVAKLLVKLLGGKEQNHESKYNVDWSNLNPIVNKKREIPKTFMESLKNG